MTMHYTNSRFIIIVIISTQRCAHPCYRVLCSSATRLFVPRSTAVVSDAGVGPPRPSNVATAAAVATSSLSPPSGTSSPSVRRPRAGPAGDADVEDLILDHERQRRTSLIRQNTRALAANRRAAAARNAPRPPPATYALTCLLYTSDAADE